MCKADWHARLKLSYKIQPLKVVVEKYSFGDVSTLTKGIYIVHTTYVLSLGSVATYARCDGILSKHFTVNREC